MALTLSKIDEMPVAPSVEVARNEPTSEKLHPILESSIEHRGEDLTIFSPQKFSKDEIKNLSSAIAIAPIEAFDCDFSRVKNAESGLMDEVKNLALMRAIAISQNLPANKDREEVEIVSEINAKFQAVGSVPRYKQISAVLNTLEVTNQAINTALNSEDVAPSLREEFSDQFRALYVKRASDFLITAAFGISAPKDMAWESDPNLTELFNLGNSMVEVSAQHDDAAIENIKGKLLIQSFNTLVDYNKTPPQAEYYSVSARDADFARTVLGRRVNEEIVEVTKAWRLPNLVTNARKVVFHFSEKQDVMVRKSRVHPGYLIENEGEVIEISRDTFEDNLYAGFGGINVSEKTRRTPGMMKNFQHEVASVVRSGKIEETMGLLETLGARYNELQGSVTDEQSTLISAEDCMRVTIALTGKDIMEKLDPNYKFDASRPVNALVKHAVKANYNYPEKHPAASFAEGLNNFRILLNFIDANPEAMNDSEVQQQLSESYIYVMRALQTCDRLHVMTQPRIFKKGANVPRHLDSAVSQKSKKS